MATLSAAGRISGRPLSSFILHELDDSVVRNRFTAASDKEARILRGWEGILGRDPDELNELRSSDRQPNTFTDSSRFGDEANESQEGSVERRVVLFGLLFLVFAIVGDSMRILVERTSFNYVNGDNNTEVRPSGSDGMALAGYWSYVFMLSILSCMSMVGTLGLTVLFVVSAQVNYTSRILQQPSIFMARAITADERRLVRGILRPPSSREAAPTVQT